MVKQFTFIICLIITGTIMSQSKAQLTIHDSTGELKWIKTGIYQNFLVELDPYNSTTINLDSLTRNVVFEFNLTEDKVIEVFTSNKKRRYRVYISPGHEMNIAIDSIGIQYSGDSELENRFMQKYNFHIAKLSKPDFLNNCTDTEYVLNLEKHYMNMLSDIDSSNFSNSFVEYMQAEIEGFKYFWMHSKYYKLIVDTTYIDTLPGEVYENVNSLFSIKEFDETKSRFYTNALSGYINIHNKNNLKADEKNNYYLKILSKKDQIDNLINFSSDLKDVFEVSLANTAMYTAKNEEHLNFAEYIIRSTSDELGERQQNAFPFIYRDLEKKKKRWNLNLVNDYTFLNKDFEEIKLSSLIKNDEEVAVYFWATWCRPCLEFLNKIDSLDLNRSFYPINIWSTRKQWTNQLERFDWKFELESFYVTKSKSDTIAQDLAIDKIPLFMVIDKELKIQRITSDKAEILKYLKE